MAKHLGVCLICGQSFERNRPLRGKTCSRVCRTIYRKEFGKGWSDGLPIGSLQTRICKGGYRYAFRKIAKGEWILEHRHVVGEIPEGCVVHHKNGNTLDNRLENLVIMTPNDHTRHHNQVVGWSRNFDQCQECQTRERRHRAFGLCVKCYARRWYQPFQRAPKPILGVG